MVGSGVTSQHGGSGFKSLGHQCDLHVHVQLSGWVLSKGGAGEVVTPGVDVMVVSLCVLALG